MGEEIKLGQATRETLRNVVLVTIQREAEFEPKPDLERVLDKFEDMIGRTTIVIRTGVLMLVKSLEMSTLAQGYRHTFSKLSPEEQKEYLNKMEGSSTYAFRGIVMGVKTLILLIYFSEPEAEAAVGYDGKCLSHARSESSSG